MLCLYFALLLFHSFASFIVIRCFFSVRVSLFCRFVLTLLDLFNNNTCHTWKIHHLSYRSTLSLHKSNINTNNGKVDMHDRRQRIVKWITVYQWINKPIDVRCCCCCSKSSISCAWPSSNPLRLSLICAARYTYATDTNTRRSDRCMQWVTVFNVWSFLLVACFIEWLHRVHSQHWFADNSSPTTLRLVRLAQRSQSLQPSLLYYFFLSFSLSSSSFSASNCNSNASAWRQRQCELRVTTSSIRKCA